MYISEKEIEDLQKAIQSVSSYDFSNYSDRSFYRRIEKILTDRNITIKKLINQLLKDYNYLEEVVRAITVNTTELFRDPETWICVKRLIEERYSNLDSINIWHAGCSTGLEVYSLMMVLNELNLLEKATIYGTDINEEVLKTAISGRYKYHEMAEYIENFDKVFNTTELNKKTNNVPLNKYIEINRLKDTLSMKSFLIEKPVFIKHDLVSTENIFNTRFHIIICRNVLIYFNHILQDKVINFFSDTLFDNGSLIIGRHEGIIGGPAANFEKKDNIYLKRATF